jgi:hypothetical protein
MEDRNMWFAIVEEMRIVATRSRGNFSAKHFSVIAFLKS